MPSADTAAAATSGDCPPTWLGQTCARATPKAGGSAVRRAGTVSDVNSPSTQNPTTGPPRPPPSSSTRDPPHGPPRPVDDLLDERRPVAGRAARGLDRRGQLGGIGDGRQALLALPVGRLDDDGPVDGGRPVVSADDPRARLRDTGLGEPL